MAKKSNSAVPDVEIADDGAEGGNATPHDARLFLEPLRTAVEGAQFRSDHSWRAWFEFSEVLENLFVRIMMEFDVSDEITEETILLLKQLSRDHVFAVRLCAERFFAARILGVEYPDMAETIEKYDAVLAALVPWLKKQNGMNYGNKKRWAS